jgi:hypothetical protein
LKDGLEGDDKQLQEELWISADCKGSSHHYGKGYLSSRGRAMKRGAFAKADIEEALSNTTRDSMHKLGFGCEEEEAQRNYCSEQLGSSRE